eukprot:scaffold52094_cov77-Phaeocystis_antarctica.AAC.1
MRSGASTSRMSANLAQASIQGKAQTFWGSSPVWHTEGDEGRGKHHDDVGGEQRYLVGAHAAHL